MVLCAVSLIQCFQFLTREYCAFKTKLGAFFLENITCLDLALPAGDRLIVVRPPAAGAFVLFPQVCHADVAVHAAGSY